MKTEKCDSCGKFCLVGQLTEFDEQFLCLDCLESATLICAHCGTRIWRDENAGDNATPLCQHCYDYHYQTCARCGRIIREEDACYIENGDDPLCHACYSYSDHEHAIHDYYYKPSPIFYGSGPRWFGVELEIDEAGEDSDSAIAEAMKDEVKSWCPTQPVMIASPTGSGKTTFVADICKICRRRSPGKKVLLLENRVAIVTQQKKALAKSLGSAWKQVQDIHALELVDELGDVNLVVMTYQKFSAHYTKMNRKQFDWVILDEAHYPRGSL